MNTTNHIHIIDDFFITVDSFNYSVSKRTGIGKKGTTVYRYYSHHHTLELALDALKREYQRNTLMDDNISTLEDAIAAIIRSNNRLEAKIREAFEGANT